MNSTTYNPEEDFPDLPPPAMSTPKVVTLEEQSKMVRAWETQAGQQRWGTAHLILEIYKVPMTQEDFLREEGLSQDLDETLANLEEEIEDGALPPWFGQLPRGD